ncbi:MAG: hypothetical protein K0R28_2669 [Paenibacillus sp.]|nr:hypothetical protein [Paenibacillus sp.]
MVRAARRAVYIILVKLVGDERMADSHVLFLRHDDGAVWRREQDEIGSAEPHQLAQQHGGGYAVMGRRIQSSCHRRMRRDRDMNIRIGA